jgi:hypothetical protein
VLSPVHGLTRFWRRHSAKDALIPIPALPLKWEVALSLSPAEKGWG